MPTLEGLGAVKKCGFSKFVLWHQIKKFTPIASEISEYKNDLLKAEYSSQRTSHHLLKIYSSAVTSYFSP